MTSLDLAFAACGLLAVVAGLLAVTTRQVVHAALWLVVALLGVSPSLPACPANGLSAGISSSRCMPMSTITRAARNDCPSSMPRRSAGSDR